MGLAKLGTNTLTLTAASSFTGPTTISGGTLNLSSGSALQASTLIAPTTGSIVFANSGVYIFGGLSGSGDIGLQTSAGTAIALTVGGNGSSTTYAGGLNGSGSLTKTGSGTLTLIGSNIFTGPTTISSGTLQIGDGNNGHDGSLASSTIADNAALVYNLYGAESYAGSTSGTGSLTKTGGGILTLSGTNNVYGGGTTVSGGTLAVTNPAALANYSTTAKVMVNSGATLTLSVGTLAWAASNVNSLVLANSGGFSPGSVLGIDTTGATGGFSDGYAITGSMGLTKFGPNTLTLSAANNTYNGGTTVSAGTLVATNPGALPGYGTVAQAHGEQQRNADARHGWNRLDGEQHRQPGLRQQRRLCSRLGTGHRHHNRQFFLRWCHCRQHGPDEVGQQHLDPHCRQHLHRPDHRRQRHARSGQRQCVAVEHPGCANYRQHRL